MHECYTYAEHCDGESPNDVRAFEPSYPVRIDAGADADGCDPGREEIRKYIEDTSRFVLGAGTGGFSIEGGEGKANAVFAYGDRLEAIAQFGMGTYTCLPLGVLERLKIEWV